MIRTLHRLPLRFLAILCIAGVFSPTWALAQEPSPSIQSLRQQIALMEKIDSDPSTTNEVRNINRTLLAARRNQLSSLLAKEIDALLKYQGTIGSSLSA